MSYVVQIHSGLLLIDSLLSHKFFNVYIDNLFRKLKSSDCGCVLFRYFYCAICFTNEIALLCSSMVGF